MFAYFNFRVFVFNCLSCVSFYDWRVFLTTPDWVWVSGSFNDFVARRCWFALSLKADYSWLDMLQMSRCWLGVCFYWWLSEALKPTGADFGVVFIAVLMSHRPTGADLCSVSAAAASHRSDFLLLGLKCRRIVTCWNGVVVVLITAFERAAGFYCG